MSGQDAYEFFTETKNGLSGAGPVTDGEDSSSLGDQAALCCPLDFIQSFHIW